METTMQAVEHDNNDHTPDYSKRRRNAGVKPGAKPSRRRTSRPFLAMRVRIAAVLCGAAAALMTLLTPALALAAEATSIDTPDRTPLTAMDMLSVVGLIVVMVIVGACVIVHRGHASGTGHPLV